MPCSISLWAIRARSIPASNQTGRVTRPLLAWSIAMSARRSRSGMLDSPAAADAIPAKALTWISRSLSRNGRVTECKTASAVISALASPSAARVNAIANSSPLRRATTAPGPSSSLSDAAMALRSRSPIS